MYVPDAQPAGLHDIADTLTGACEGIHELTLRREPSLDPQRSAVSLTAIQRVITACPYLHTLRLDRCPCALPPPCQLPHLVQLDLGSPLGLSGVVCEDGKGLTAEAVCASVSAHIPTVITLTAGCWDSYWQQIFTTPAHHLTHFTTSSALTDDLLTCLCDHAPALTHLGVGGLDMHRYTHSQRVWGVGEVCVGRVGELSVRELTYLPRTR